ncbi:unnamed protein product [Psylliodes chrysocephalus]|uniref:Regulatory protein zeste n=1 Tax=Psylliodes chrysocephalus TaxID=3402493 RepID=A0A9P0CR60_9CUCU|nr:unnamed protein product [Psylliodes chrysocephala]
MLVEVDRKKSGHVSDTQMQRLINFVENDPDIRTGKFTNKFTYKGSQQRWKIITEQLNSSPGAKNDWSSWRRTWQDLKRNTRKKSADINKYKMGTGGGPPPKELTDNEAVILEVIDVSTINELELIEESTIDHNYWTGNNQILSQEPSKAGTIGQILSQDPSKAEEVFPKENIENSVPNTTISSEKPKRRRMATKRLTKTLKASENMQTIIKDENATKGSH